MSNHQYHDDIPQFRTTRRFRFFSYASVVLILIFFAGLKPFLAYLDTLKIGELREKEQKRLEFVHIPKTGGTAIESIAKNANLTWSICHFGSPEAVSKISNGLVRCYCNNNNNNHIETPKNHSQSRTNWQKGLFWESNRCPWWHVPPSHVEAFYPRKGSPYADADLFAIVRNPYERIISEIYYTINELDARRNKNSTKIRDAGHINKVIFEKLSEFSSKKLAGDLEKGIPGNIMYYSYDGHLIPQYDFVYDKAKKRRIIEHVLYFENIHVDFSNLMAEYGLPLALPTKRVRPKSDHKLEVWDLTMENMLLIEDIYRDDFREFGYEMLSQRRRRNTQRTRNDDI